MPENPIFGDYIHTYSRAEAIADGVLVALSQDEDKAMLRSLGFRCDVAMTAAAYHAAVAPEDRALPQGQDRNGRLWDVLWMLRMAIKRHPTVESTLVFALRVATLCERRTRFDFVRLKVLAVAGDDGELVLTIMLPDED